MSHKKNTILVNRYGTVFTYEPQNPSQSLFIIGNVYIAHSGSIVKTKSFFDQTSNQVFIKSSDESPEWNKISEESVIRIQIPDYYFFVGEESRTGSFSYDFVSTEYRPSDSDVSTQVIDGKIYVNLNRNPCKDIYEKFNVYLMTGSIYMKSVVYSNEFIGTSSCYNVVYTPPYQVPTSTPNDNWVQTSIPLIVSFSNNMNWTEI